MKCHKANKFKALNFNLKNEIFSFNEFFDNLQFMHVCKAFKFAVDNSKWCKLIKENKEYFQSKANLYFSKMKNCLI